MRATAAVHLVHFFLLTVFFSTQSVHGFSPIAGSSILTSMRQQQQQQSALASHFSSSSSQQHHRRRRRRSSSLVLASSLVDTVSVVNQFFIEFPYAAAGLTCGAKASAADLVAQKRDNRNKQNNNSDIDSDEMTSVDDEENNSSSKFQFQRNLAFLIYGAVYQGMAQEYVYNHLYPAMFGNTSAVTVVLSKVLFDLLVQTTLLTLPVAYVTKALIYRYSFQKAMMYYWNDIRYEGLLTKYFLLWGPVQCITFSIIPVHFRVSFIALVSFFWLIILSTIASKNDVKQK